MPLKYPGRVVGSVSSAVPRQFTSRCGHSFCMGPISKPYAEHKREVAHMDDAEWEQLKSRCIPLNLAPRIAIVPSLHQPFSLRYRKRVACESSLLRLTEASLGTRNDTRTLHLVADTQHRGPRVTRSPSTIQRMREDLAPISRQHPMGYLVGQSISDWHRSPSSSCTWGPRRKRSP